MPRQYTEHISYEYTKKVSPGKGSKEKSFIDINNNPINNSNKEDLDDEYNPYRYGFRPISERNIYRSYEVIRPEQESNKNYAKVTKMFTVPTETTTFSGGLDEVDNSRFRFTEPKNTYEQTKEEENIVHQIPIINERPIDVPGISIENRNTSEPVTRFIKISMPNEDRKMNVLDAKPPLPPEHHRVTSKHAKQQRSTSRSSSTSQQQERNQNDSSPDRINIPVFREYTNRNLQSEPIPTTFHSYKCTKYELEEKKRFL